MPSHFAHIDSGGLVLRVEAVTADFIAANPDRYVGRWLHCNPPRTFCGVGWMFDATLDDFVSPIEVGEE